MEAHSLRPAREADAASIAAMVGSAADLHQVAPYESHPLEEDVVAHWLRSRDGGLVLESDTELVAYAEINRDAAQKQVWWISHVIVHPRHRRRGVGRELIRQVVEHAARTRGAKALWLSVFQDNPAGLHTYKRSGFRFAGSRSIDGRQLLDLSLDLEANEPTISRRGVLIFGAIAALLTLGLLPGETRAALAEDHRLSWWWLMSGAAISTAGIALAARRLLPRRSDVGISPLLRPLSFGLVVGVVVAMLWSLASPLYLRGGSFLFLDSLNLGLQYGAGWGLVCSFLSQLLLRIHQLPASGPAVGSGSFPP